MYISRPPFNEIVFKVWAGKTICYEIICNKCKEIYYNSLENYNKHNYSNTCPIEDGSLKIWRVIESAKQEKSIDDDTISRFKALDLT